MICSIDITGSRTTTSWQNFPQMDKPAFLRGLKSSFQPCASMKRTLVFTQQMRTNRFRLSPPALSHAAISKKAHLAGASKQLTQYPLLHIVHLPYARGDRGCKLLINVWLQRQSLRRTKTCQQKLSGDPSCCFLHRPGSKASALTHREPTMRTTVNMGGRGLTASASLLHHPGQMSRRARVNGLKPLQCKCVSS